MSASSASHSHQQQACNQANQNLFHADLPVTKELSPFLHNGSADRELTALKKYFFRFCQEVFLALQASEQYLIDSQFLAQDFRHVISFLQTTQILLGKKLLFPLNDAFVMIA
jgi:hypothetical protein